MIERFITILRRAEVSLDYRQIEDALWLSGVLPRHTVEESDESPEPPKPGAGEAEDRKRDQQRPTMQPQSAEHTRNLYTPSTAATGAQFSASRIRVPAASALPEALLISRALRPLSRRVRSKYLFKLDEDATVEQSARSRMITPVFTPAAERWFDVALVVEDAPSMVVWQQTIRELTMLLERQGAFRDVRRWRLRIEIGKAHLIEPAGATRSVKALNDPSSRRLVVLLSDCASPCWRDGSLSKVLLEWGSQMPVVIGHMLSERLWRHTATGEASVTVASMTQGAPNRLLDPELPWWDEEIAGRMPFPIISLNHELISQWARMLTSVGAKYKATLLPTESSATITPEPSTAEERVDRFRSVVSNEAYDLAVFLSVMPLTLPVMRLVHQAMIRNARQEQLAEALLGQIIRRKTPPDEQRPPEEIEYEFYPEVREILQGEIQYSELDRVFQSISNFVGRRIGSTRDFVAWIKDSEGDAQISVSSSPFAEIALPALERMGLANLLKDVELGAQRARRKISEPGEYVELEGMVASETPSLDQSIETLHQPSVMEGMPSKAKVLVIDGDPEMLDLARFHLEKNGYEVTCAETGAQGLRLIAEHRHEVALTDLKLPDIYGIDLVEKLKEVSPGTEVIMITGYGSVTEAIEATKAGAFYFMEKPVEFGELMTLIERAIERRRQVEEIERLRGLLRERYSYYGIIGSSQSMQNIYEIIESIAESDANVMILGESGTGKELIANVIHLRSARSKKPFVKVNLPLLPEKMFESELFGLIIQGAFTGSTMGMMGLIDQAAGGSLLLDEIDMMPVELQPKLLRVLQERVYYRVGSEEALEADFRLISTINRDPLEAIREGTLREDLYYRINTIEIEVPPLRERAEDVQHLAEHFLRIYAEKSNRSVRSISQQAYERMFAYSWPGNVRELQSVMERAVLLAEGDVIEESAIPAPEPSTRIVAPHQDLQSLTNDDLLHRHQQLQRDLLSQVWRIIEIQEQVDSLKSNPGPQWESLNNDLIVATSRRQELGQTIQSVFIELQSRQITPPESVEALLIQTVISDVEKFGERRNEVIRQAQIVMDSRKAANKRAEGEALYKLGQASNKNDDHSRAIQFYQFAEKEAQNDYALQFKIALGMASSLSELGLAVEAEKSAQSAQSLALRLNNEEMQLDALVELGKTRISLGRLEMAVDTFEKTLEMARRLENRRCEIQSLNNLGVAHYSMGKTRRAIEFYEQALAIARETSDRRAESLALGNLGIAYKDSGEPKHAIEIYEKVLAIARETRDRRNEGQTLGNLGLAYAALGEPKRAIEFHEQDLAIAREIGDRRGEGNALGNLGIAYKNLGEPKRAIEIYEQRLEIARKIGDRRGEGNVLGNLGVAYKNLGEPRRAIDFHVRQLVIARETSDRRSERNAIHGLGMAYSDLGEIKQALALFEQAQFTAREISDRFGEANARQEMGNLLMREADVRGAQEQYQAALKINEELGNIADVSSILHQIGTLHQTRRDYEQALDYYQRSIKLSETLSDITGIARSLNQIGNIYQYRSEYDAALDCYHRSLKIKEDTGDMAGVSKSLINIGNIYQYRSEYDAALDCYQRSLRINEELGDMAGVSKSLYSIGMVQQAVGAYDEAFSNLRLSLSIVENLGDIVGIARALDQIGNIYCIRGSYDEALISYQRSIKIFENLGDIAGIASSLHNIGNIYYIRGSYNEALNNYQRSLDLSEELKNTAGVAKSLHSIGMLHQALREHDAALEYYQRSLNIAEELGDIASVSGTLHQVGMVHQALGAYDVALDYYQRSLKIKERLSNIAGVASSEGQIGLLMMELGRYEQAFSMIVNALNTFIKLKSPDADISVNLLKRLRDKWGPQNFDAAWWQTEGEPVPEWVTRDNGPANTETTQPES